MLLTPIVLLMFIKAEIMYEVTPRSSVFCDYFTITTPPDYLQQVLAALRPYLYDLGCSEEPGAFRLPDGFGLFSFRVKHKVALFASSGGFASALRDKSLLSLFLAEFFSFPHNVSSADFTVDEYVSAPDRLSEIYRTAIDGEVSFTRKKITASSVSFLMSPVCYDDSGRNTGTLYLGKRGRHEVFAKVYDKRQQLKQQRMIDVRDVLRHEVTITSKMGLTLRDIASPHDCFYHFYPSNLLSKAKSEHWVGGETGFRLEKPPERLPAEILRIRVETSRELESMLDLVEQVGCEGLKYLFRQITNKYERRNTPALAL